MPETASVPGWQKGGGKIGVAMEQCEGYFSPFSIILAAKVLQGKAAIILLFLLFFFQPLTLKNKFSRKKNKTHYGAIM